MPCTFIFIGISRISSPFPFFTIVLKFFFCHFFDKEAYAVFFRQPRYAVNVFMNIISAIFINHNAYACIFVNSIDTFFHVIRKIFHKLFL